MTWKHIPAERYDRQRVMPRNVFIAAFKKNDRTTLEIFRCVLAEHGTLFPNGDMISLLEDHWVPYAWREDDMPEPEDRVFPPVWTDYLTDAADES